MWNVNKVLSHTRGKVIPIYNYTRNYYGENIIVGRVIQSELGHYIIYKVNSRDDVWIIGIAKTLKEAKHKTTILI